MQGVPDAMTQGHERGVGAQVPALTDEEVAALLSSGAIVHDSRGADEFSAGHLAGSVSVPADGRMAETAGMVFRPQDRIVVLAPAGLEQDVGHPDGRPEGRRHGQPDADGERTPSGPLAGANVDGLAH